MRTYGQYCGLAKALDHVGDRWTLLIVRELLVGPRRYSELRAALPGIATNLLAHRLRTLEEDGIVARADGSYELTEVGRGLEPAIHDLVRWGGMWMTAREESDSFDARWLVVALRALLPGRRRGRVQLRVEGESLYITRTEIGIGETRDPDAVVEATADLLLGVVTRHAPLSRLKVRGDRALAAAVLQGGTARRAG